MIGKNLLICRYCILFWFGEGADHTIWNICVHLL